MRLILEVVSPSQIHSNIQQLNWTAKSFLMRWRISCTTWATHGPDLATRSLDDGLDELGSIIIKWKGTPRTLRTPGNFNSPSSPFCTLPKQKMQKCLQFAAALPDLPAKPQHGRYEPPACASSAQHPASGPQWGSQTDLHSYRTGQLWTATWRFLAPHPCRHSGLGPVRFPRGYGQYCIGILQLSWLQHGKHIHARPKYQHKHISYRVESVKS